MDKKFLFYICLVLAITIAMVNASCLCGAKGQDFCSCKSCLVRPVSQGPCKLSSLINGGKGFLPIGDVCSCGNHIVKPAIVPRAPCEQTQQVPTKTCNCDATIRAPEAYQGPNTDGAQVYQLSNNKVRSGVPADAVSLGLAYKYAQQASISVPEEKLAYGFRTLPKYHPNKKVCKDVPEERLWVVERDIVELKPPRIEHEEEEEEELIEEEEEVVSHAPNYLTYNEIGYCPVRHHDSRFYVETHQPQAKTCKDETPAPCGECGLRLGEVVDGGQRDYEYRYGAQSGGIHSDDDYEEHADYTSVYDSYNRDNAEDYSSYKDYGSSSSSIGSGDCRICSGSPLLNKLHHTCVY